MSRLVSLKKHWTILRIGRLVHRMVRFAILLLRDFLHGKLSLLGEIGWSAAAHNGHLRHQQSYCTQCLTIHATWSLCSRLCYTQEIQLDSVDSPIQFIQRTIQSEYKVPVRRWKVAVAGLGMLLKEAELFQQAVWFSLGKESWKLNASSTTFSNKARDT